MTASCFHFTTTASTNLKPVKAGVEGKFMGFSTANVATAMWMKLYWTAGAPPTVGTTVPNLTIGLIVSGQQQGAFDNGVTGNGQLWVAVTGAAADSDSSNSVANAVITLLVE